MHQWVQQKELNNKNEQSVVIIILVATLFFRHFLRKQLQAAFGSSNIYGYGVMAY
ncbi:hypothetical protein I230019B6_06140 [Firmicutes bacterium i23-0019-B6]